MAETIPLFEIDSYVGNLGLCGVPLTRKCENKTRPEEEDGFGWKSAVMGYGCGFIVGIGMGYCVLRSWKAKMVG